MAENNFTEKSEAISMEELKKEEQETYNRKNVNGIKRMLVVLFLFVCAMPLLFCLYLLARMNNIERKLDDVLKNNIKAQATVEEISTEDVAYYEDNTVDVLELEEDAYYNIEKNTESGNHQLSSSKDTKKVVSNGKKVYLTFDDGPTRYTGELLKILRKNNVKATFFVVCSENEQYWRYYDEIVAEGHSLGMHSYSHVYDDVYESLESFENDVKQIHDFLYDETGVDCKLYRFPGGSSNSVSNVDILDMIEYLDKEGITYYDWNALSGDAVDEGLSPEELNEVVLDYIRNNEGDSVVLLHDLDFRRETIDGLQSLIDTLKEEGYELCPINENTTPVQHVTK